MQLGRLGVWSHFEQLTGAQSAEFVNRIEQWGYSAVWTPEAVGRDAIEHSGWLLANTRSLIVATGVANIYARDPMLLHAGQMSLNERSGGRFLLGIGVSRSMFVSDIRGHEYGRPVATMRHYLQAMKNAMYVAPPPAEPPKTVIAALGPKMLELARDEADGAHPYIVPPVHTQNARRILGAGKLLCVGQMALLETDATRARQIAREALAIYLGLPNYLNNWRRLGYTDADFSDGGSDRLVDDIVAWGDEAAVTERIKQQWQAGADHVCLHMIAPDQAAKEKQLATLAKLNR